MKPCTRCGEVKNLEDFPRNVRFKDGRLSRCRSCEKVAKARYYQETLKHDKVRLLDYRLRAKYGMSLAQFEEMKAAQGGVCAICGELCNTNQRLSVDHCHETGQVRGLLCRSCNTGIGGLRSNPDLLRSAIAYLTGDAT